MAQIREELQLVDRFSATFTRYIRQSQRAATSTQEVRRATNSLSQSERANATATEHAGRATQEFSQNQRRTISTSNELATALKKVVNVYAIIKGAKWLVNTSDEMTSTTARINMMNDGLQTTDELNNMIYESAQRSRGAYADTAAFVAKLGTLAGNAFDSSAEIVAFAEQINKQLTLSGASTQEAQAAMLQLTQGLSSGALRGEELNSVLEQAPMIAQSIAKYMGVTTGEMRELASDGKVTAEVVKNAMFAAAKETDKSFENMPMTWAQVWTRMQNVAIKALQPLTDKISELAQTGQLEDAIDTIGKALNGAAIAASYLIDGISWLTDVVKDFAPQITLVVAALAGYELGVTLATAAQWAWNAALDANPIGLVIILIVALIAIFITLWDKCEGFRNFWVDMWAQMQESVLWVVNNVIIPIANFFISTQNRVGTAITNFAKLCITAYYDAAINISKSVGNIIEKLQGLINIYNSVATAFGGPTIRAEVFTQVLPESFEAAKQNALSSIDAFSGKYLPQRDLNEKLDEDAYRSKVQDMSDQMRNFTFGDTFNKLISDLFGVMARGETILMGDQDCPICHMMRSLATPTILQKTPKTSKNL